MRTAVVRKDGSLDISKEIEKTSIDLRRYLRFRDGETLLQIAESDQLTPDAVKISLRIGRQMHEASQMLTLRDLKYTGAIETEQIRQQVRDSVKDKIVSAVDQLLTGKRTIVETETATGKVTLHEIVDPEVISMGITHARKIVSLDEKPAANQTTVNIQNNQNNSGSEAPTPVGGLSYEDRLRNIRSAQTNKRVIEAEFETSAEEPAEADNLTPVEMGTPVATAPEKDWEF